MAARGECVGFELLNVGAVAVGLANIPANATMLRVFMNPQGATGANAVSIMYFDGTAPDATNGVQFTDAGGFIEIMARNSINAFQAVALDGNTYDLQVFYHIFPWQ